jgi:hypothetical protein
MKNQGEGMSKTLRQKPNAARLTHSGPVTAKSGSGKSKKRAITMAHSKGKFTAAHGGFGALRSLSPNKSGVEFHEPSTPPTKNATEKTRTKRLKEKR